jgi:hypothetical protein
MASYLPFKIFRTGGLPPQAASLRADRAKLWRRRLSDLIAGQIMSEDLFDVIILVALVTIILIFVKMLL